MTTKNRRAVGTLGLAAVVAVLAVSMIAMNFTAQPAAADHIAAKKGGGYYGNVAVGITNTGLFNVTTVDALLAEFDIKTNDKGDWLVDMAMECATANQVESKGKKNNLEGSKASATAFIKVDNVTQNDITWNVCSQDLQLKTQLNDLIVACTQEQFDAGLCHSVGSPVFFCQFLNATELENTECEQSIEIFLETAGAYNVKWFLMNLDAGVHHIEIWTTLTAERTAGGFEEDVDLNDSQKITSAVFINQVLVYAEPVHMMNDADLG